ncbi:MAG TPA: peptide-binding protein [Candidatus Limnocylindrales bacterium]|nr:peptide-binding protein [Candidatus Limnocylindrales bacterium]
MRSERSFAVVLALVLAAGCGGSDGAGDNAATPPAAQPASGDATPARGDAIVFGTIGDASTLIPMLASDSASHEYSGNIFDGLVEYDKTLSRLEPRLAEKWEVEDGGQKITFHLRHDVHWTDGQPFTARDVEFGFNLIRDPATLTPYAEDYKQVQTFELLDDYSFRVTYEKPYAPALESWGSMVVLPRHLLEGKNINETDFGQHPVGLGSHRFESWERNRLFTLRANPDYYRGRPWIERVVYRVIPDESTQFLELRSGGIDEMGLTPLQYSRQTSTPAFARDFRKYRYVSNSYTYMGYNLSDERFADVRVRRAFSHAINKQEIVDAVLFGLGRPAEGPYRPGTAWMNEKLQPYEFDPAKARALLAEAGWTDSDGDGILDKNGKPFSFKILTNQNEQRLKTATMIQKRLRDIGVDAQLRVLEWSAFINDFIDKRRFEVIVLGWSLSLDPDQFPMWHSSQTGYKKFNFVGYNNPEVDDLLEKGRRTFDVAERKRMYDRLQEILYEDQPYTFLYVPEATPIVAARIHGIEEAPAGISWNFPFWYVPKGEQKYVITE